ncbi:MAG: tryptophan-rich sensory protein, partial [Clostridia bacterium]|nr:tryptophan-rich sensory protein [Clostridia bacterium]
LSPPTILFPIVWTILYILLGIAAYLISEKHNSDTKSALRLYWIQIIANSLWSLFFWRFEWFTFAAIWIGLLIVLTAILIPKFARLNRTSAWLFLPYLVWLFFALYLNIGFAILN